MSSRNRKFTHVFASMLLLQSFCIAAPGQEITGRPHHPIASHVIIPQSRSFVARRNQPTVEIAQVDVGVVIVEQVATTTMEILLRNPSSARLEAEMIVPVPDDAVVHSFDFEGKGKEPSAKILPRDEARRVYDSIVRKMQDPALLEFIDYNMIRSSVFPVEPNGSQKVRLTYESILPSDGNRVDYVLPRSESLDYQVPWKIRVTVKSKKGVVTVYSPTHGLETAAGKDPNRISARLASDSENEPGPFRLSYLAKKNGVTASLMAYPDGKGNGYFLMLAGLPESAAVEQTKKIKREVTLVLDRSGSMNGEKLIQVRESAKQIIAGLDDGEAFNIIFYNEAVETFSDAPVIKDEKTGIAAIKFLNSLKARGGTNIHDALLESLRQEPQEGMLPMVLFLTDGRPTIGKTSEKIIRELATDSNPHNRRIFTFGVGVDVNSPLLENLAFQSRASSTFVLPNEDVEVKIASVFDRLAGPALANPTLKILDADGNSAIGRITDLLPSKLPDLFQGDQLVLIGRYVDNKPITFKLTGNYRGETKTFKFDFKFDKATTKHAYIPRLWAGRQIGILVDEIRSSGVDPATAVNDPKLKELVDEIVRLSTEFGILTEYTAFLALEGSDLSARSAVLAEAMGNFQRRAIAVRGGAASVNQDMNNIQQKGQAWGNRRNRYFDQNLKQVEIANVRQVADRAFYYKSDHWIDSRLVDKKKSEAKPDREVEFGSPEFMKIARSLAASGRQGSVAFDRDTLLLLDEEKVLIKAPQPK